MARQGRRCGQLLEKIRERRKYWKLTAEALDRTQWKTRFGRGYGPVVDYRMKECCRKFASDT